MEYKIIPIDRSPAVVLARKVIRRRSSEITRKKADQEVGLSEKVFGSHEEDELYFNLEGSDHDDEDFSLFFSQFSSGKLQKLYKKILKLKYPYLRTLDTYT